MRRKITWEKWENNFIPSNETGEDEDLPVQSPPFIHTPYGAITMKMFAPEKNNLNFWCGHTNFDLGMEECSIIDDTPGVEILDLFSAYTFRMCIGANFQTDKVKRLVDLRLGCRRRKLVNKEVKKLKIDLQDCGKMWLIYTLPNGKHEHYTTDNEQDFEDRLDKYMKAEFSIGGNVIYGV